MKYERKVFEVGTGYFNSGNRAVHLVEIDGSGRLVITFTDTKKEHTESYQNKHEQLVAKKEHTESYQLKLMNDKLDALIEILGTSTIAKPGLPYVVTRKGTNLS